MAKVGILNEYGVHVVRRDGVRPKRIRWGRVAGYSLLGMFLMICLVLDIFVGYFALHPGQLIDVLGG